MTSPLTELRQRFLEGVIDKHEYSRQVNVHHRTLTQHAEFMAGSDICEISLTPDGVTLVSRFGGVRFPCMLSDRGLPPMIALDFGSYESKDFALLLALFPRGGTFVDVGASIGWYSLHVANADATARVVAIEPVPTTYRSLERAIAANNLRNVVAINVAVTGQGGELALYLDPNHSGAASSIPSTGAEGLQQVVSAATTLDEIALRIGRPIDVLKLDIEGGELAALQGATTVLGSHRPIIFCEMLRKFARAFGYHPNDIISLLAEHGYQCFRCTGGKLERFETMEEATIETNFFFLHNEVHARVISEWSRAELHVQSDQSARPPG